MSKCKGYVVEFDAKSAVDSKNILKYYNVKTEDEAKNLAELYRGMCQASKYKIMPMSDEFELNEVEIGHNNYGFNVVRKEK